MYIYAHTHYIYDMCRPRGTQLCTSWLTSPHSCSVARHVFECPQSFVFFSACASSTVPGAPTQPSVG